MGRGYKDHFQNQVKGTLFPEKILCFDSRYLFIVYWIHTSDDNASKPLPHQDDRIVYIPSLIRPVEVHKENIHKRKYKGNNKKPCLKLWIS